MNLLFIGDIVGRSGRRAARERLAALRDGKRADLVVANAGGPPPGRFADTRPKDWDAAYRLTLRSALELAAAARRTGVTRPPVHRHVKGQTLTVTLSWRADPTWSFRA